MNREKVLSTIKKYRMLSDSDSVVVGVSGGADSMALLAFLLEEKKTLKLSEVIACHYNHGLRGEESDRDEALVKAFCEERKVVFVSEYGDMLSRPLPKGESTESFARILRYEFLNKVAKEHSAKIATAHNMNDVAETVIFNLARGAGIKGAGGIPPVRENIIRPFIETERSEIEAYCKEKGISYATDSTNLTDDYTRNIIRHKIIPVLVSLNESAVNNISRFSAQAIEADEVLKANNERIKREVMINGGYSAEALRKVSEGERKYFFKALIAEHRETSSELASLACALLNSEPSEIQLNRDTYITNKNGVVFVRKRHEEQDITFCEKLSIGENAFLENKVVTVKTIEINNEQAENFSSGLLNNSIDCAKIVGNAVLRNRRDGDSFSGNRRGNTKTLKKLFNEKGIAPRDRQYIPIISDDIGILWIYGEGTSKRAAVDKNTKKALNILLLQGEDKR